MDCSLPGSSVHGIFQARALEWGAIAFSIMLQNRIWNPINHLFITLHSNRLVGLTLWIDFLLVNDFVASSIGHLENICSLNFKDFQMLTHFIIQITWWLLPILNGALKIGKLPSWWCQTHVFCLSLEGSDFTLSRQHLLSDVFLNVRLNLLFLRKRLQSMLFSITSLSVLLSSKSEISQKQQPVNFATEISEWALFLGVQHSPWVCSQSVPHRIWKTRVLKGWNWVQLTFPPLCLRFPGGSDGKESACSAGDQGSIPGLGRSPGEGNSNPLQYSGLENPMDRGAWWLQSVGSQRVGHSLRLGPSWKHCLMHLFAGDAWHSRLPWQLGQQLLDLDLGLWAGVALSLLLQPCWCQHSGLVGGGRKWCLHIVMIKTDLTLQTL